MSASEMLCLCVSARISITISMLSSISVVIISSIIIVITISISIVVDSMLSRRLAAGRAASGSRVATIRVAPHKLGGTACLTLLV